MRSEVLARPGANTGTISQPQEGPNARLGNEELGTGEAPNLAATAGRREQSERHGAPPSTETRPPVQLRVQQCRVTGHIRSAAGCSGVGPRHRAGPGGDGGVPDRAPQGVLRSGIGTSGEDCRARRRPGRLEQGGEAWSSRRAHNAEFAGSNPAPAIDRGDGREQRALRTLYRRGRASPRSLVRRAAP